MFFDRKHRKHVDNIERNMVPERHTVAVENGKFVLESGKQIASFLKEGGYRDTEQILLELQLRESRKPFMEKMGKLCPYLLLVNSSSTW